MYMKDYNIDYLCVLKLGDWGLGIGDWAQSPIPNPQSPIPNIYIYVFMYISGLLYIIYSNSIIFH